MCVCLRVGCVLRSLCAPGRGWVARHKPRSPAPIQLSRPPFPPSKHTAHTAPITYTHHTHSGHATHTHASHTQQKKQHSALHLVAKVGAGRHVCTIGGAGLQHALRLVERRERRVERLTQRDERVGDDDADEAAEAEEWTGREEREEGGAVASTRGAFL